MFEIYAHPCITLLRVDFTWKNWPSIWWYYCNNTVLHLVYSIQQYYLLVYSSDPLALGHGYNFSHNKGIIHVHDTTNFNISTCILWCLLYLSLIFFLLWFLCWSGWHGFIIYVHNNSISAIDNNIDDTASSCVLLHYKQGHVANFCCTD